MIWAAVETNSSQRPWRCQKLWHVVVSLRWENQEEMVHPEHRRVIPADYLVLLPGRCESTVEKSE